MLRIIARARGSRARSGREMGAAVPAENYIAPPGKPGLLFSDRDRPAADCAPIPRLIELRGAALGWRGNHTFGCVKNR